MRWIIELPDGTLKEYDRPVSPADVAADISSGLLKRAIGAEVNDQLWDLKRQMPEKAKLRLILEKDHEAAEFYRHTFSHILAQAVMRLYGADKVKLGIGPVIEDGFYYDFDLGDTKLSEEDLPRIEEEMNKIIKEDLPIERFELPKKEAIELMEEKGQIYKIELIEELADETVSFYRQGEFVDLCRGPHMPSTGRVKYFKLLSVSGAYWRGDEKNKMLQRVYGTAFSKKSELETYITRLEEAKKRDHRKLGSQLGLFSFSYDYAPGMPLFHPKGATILNELMKFSREMHIQDGYQEVITPLVMNIDLWKQSGHWDHYRDAMYFTEKEGQEYAVKPMNCPGHILIYKSGAVSYRDLPLKLFEFGRVHRYERSGVLHGIFRVRGFIQDDAHIFCTKDQITEEIKGVIRFVDKIYSPFGFQYRAELSTRPEDFMGDIEIWDIATEALKEALESAGLNYKVNEGDGAFYGPKIDFHVRDSIGREWQCATIQLDFLMPERFNLTYIGPDNQEYRPVMIHRAIYGSLERFFGILIEHYAGAFPTWLAPVQVTVIPIADRHVDYAKKVALKLRDAGIRVEVDDRQKSTNYKIRDAQLQKSPYMLIVGDKEVEEEVVSVRLRTGENFYGIKLDVFVTRLKEEINKRLKNSVFKA
ncbi:threonine--tRNA ligase [Kosmotoga pacifica]|uniref:Threonine--tRNA ligase n=1 Tax=Kosmotoga pacifica TaxID=1330330 RepID=A0A0G2ZD16_9BACT|nr:threonine--tRNA ligase [Kosmotoga pacifica]AKI96703.1 threonyl-tRNA synthetase [Kosmotoga pacifica]